MITNALLPIAHAFLSGMERCISGAWDRPYAQALISYLYDAGFRVTDREADDLITAFEANKNGFVNMFSILGK